MMRIYRFELKKLLSSVAVWGFLAACLSVNMAFVCNSRDPYGDFIGTVSKQTGYVLNNDFYDKLSKLTVEKAHADYLERLKIETENVEDVFEGYNAKRIGERYIEAAKLEGIFAEAMRHKYARLQKVTDEKAKNDESLSLYFAGSTYYRHQFLFNDLIGFLLTEGALFRSFGFARGRIRRNFRTENLVYSSKKAVKSSSKLFASLSAELCLRTFGVYHFPCLFRYQRFRRYRKASCQAYSITESTYCRRSTVYNVKALLSNVPFGGALCRGRHRSVLFLNGIRHRGVCSKQLHILFPIPYRQRGNPRLPLQMPLNSIVCRNLRHCTFR